MDDVVRVRDSRSRRRPTLIVIVIVIVVVVGRRRTASARVDVAARQHRLPVGRPDADDAPAGAGDGRPEGPLEVRPEPVVDGAARVDAGVEEVLADTDGALAEPRRVAVSASTGRRWTRATSALGRSQVGDRHLQYVGFLHLRVARLLSATVTTVIIIFQLASALKGLLFIDDTRIVCGAGSM